MKKKYYTKEEFQKILDKKANLLNKNENIFKKSYNLISDADKYYLTHQTKFLDETSLNNPFDLMVFSEIIFKYKPDFIIELGTAWCGTTLFLSSILNVINKGTVIGVDIYIPKELKLRLKKYKTLNSRIKLLKGESSSKKVISSIKKIIKKKSKILLIIDSKHDEKTVYEELLIYEQLMAKGSYLVCCDTIDELGFKQNRRRDWGKGNNSYTALQKFLNENNRFIYDTYINNKLLISLNKHGYYKCIK